MNGGGQSYKSDTGGDKLAVSYFHISICDYLNVDVTHLLPIFFILNF